MTPAAHSPEVQPVIRMQDVAIGSLRNPQAVVAEGVSWTVYPGEYWVVAGLQGSGKSDFAMTLAGLTAPLRGSYRLFEEDMPIFEGDRLATRLRLGLVFDGGHLLQHLSIRENITLPLQYHRILTATELDKRVHTLLEATELTPWAESMPSALGRNWHKRAGLARALILRPEVLILDNPLAGLDPHHTDWWLGFLGLLSAGHPLCGGRPMTLIVTVSDLHPFQGQPVRVATLKDRQFQALGPWPQDQPTETSFLRHFGIQPKK
jgi:ABC-type transporter Mla maintaining outer membrane lipid asymmetry ATPase subunit MlaF